MFEELRDGAVLTSDAIPAGAPGAYVEVDDCCRVEADASVGEVVDLFCDEVELEWGLRGGVDVCGHAVKVLACGGSADAGVVWVTAVAGVYFKFDAACLL